MTPDDLAGCRQRINLHTMSPLGVDVANMLADALEAAWAERDVYAQQRCTVVGHDIAMIEELRERAERAEREAHNARIQRDNAMADYIRCDDALARVRALCEQLRYGSNEEASVARELRAAIEGP